jgi:hypothetical protein
MCVHRAMPTASTWRRGQKAEEISSVVVRDAETPANPLLPERGVRVRLPAPLISSAAAPDLLVR